MKNKWERKQKRIKINRSSCVCNWVTYDGAHLAHDLHGETNFIVMSMYRIMGRLEGDTSIGKVLSRVRRR